MHNCPGNCNYRGSCEYSTGTCRCYSGFNGYDCGEMLCSSDCYGHGRCNLETGRCVCDSPFYGFNCALRKCPRGCSDRGYCDYSSNACACYATSFGDICQFIKCPMCARGDADEQFDRCVCPDGWYGPACDQASAVGVSMATGTDSTTGVGLTLGTRDPIWVRTLGGAVTHPVVAEQSPTANIYWLDLNAGSQSCGAVATYARNISLPPIAQRDIVMTIDFYVADEISDLRINQFRFGPVGLSQRYGYDPTDQKSTVAISADSFGGAAPSWVPAGPPNLLEVDVTNYGCGSMGLALQITYRPRTTVPGVVLASGMLANGSALPAASTDVAWSQTVCGVSPTPTMQFLSYPCAPPSSSCGPHAYTRAFVLPELWDPLQVELALEWYVSGSITDLRVNGHSFGALTSNQPSTRRKSSIVLSAAPFVQKELEPPWGAYPASNTLQVVLDDASTCGTSPGLAITLVVRLQPNPQLRTCSDRGTCNSNLGLCNCDRGFYGRACENKKCPEDCNGRGSCNEHLGTCSCYPLYTGHACQDYLCPRNCSGHGQCDHRTALCTCSDGFSAHDCSVKGAFVPGPAAAAFCQCSENGVCDFTTGHCSCLPGYYGHDCSRRLADPFV